MVRAKRKPAKVGPRTKVGTHHDGLFHLAFSVPRHAESELKNLLSSEIVSRIKWDKLRNVSGKFVDAKLTNRYSDILYEVEIDDQKALISVLFEHKSAPDRWTLLQIFEYMARIWNEYLRKTPSAKRLPLILPVVVHHGEWGWTAPREFKEYFGEVPEELRCHIPNFGILLDDVGKVSPEKLLGRSLTPEAKFILLCLLLGRTPEKFFAELQRNPEVLQGTWNGTDKAVVIGGVVVYLQNVSGVPQGETIMALQNLLNLSPAEEIIYAHEILSRHAREEVKQEGRLEGRLEGKQEGLLEGTQKGKLEGKQEGLLEGTQKGKLEGALELVTRLLTKRFGPLSPDATSRLKAATKTELEDIGLRVLSASTLDEALGKPKRKRK